MVLFLISFIIKFVFVLLAVAFYTLFERKILSLAQIRLGPNKIIFQGIGQPLIDGLKLIVKEMSEIILFSWNKLNFYPFLMFVIVLFLWFLFPSKFLFSSRNLESVFFLFFLGMMIFFIMFLAVMSKSKFGILGSVRSASQTISYEISLCLIFFSPLFIFHSLQLLKNFNFFLNFSFLIVLIWWMSCVMECNRAPFDFSEGESELISGFNVEYSSLGFVYIFLGEYGMMLFFSLFSTKLFFFNFIWFFFFFFSLILIRACYPRYRFDLLMSLCWFKFLPFSVFFLGLCIIFFY